MSYVIALDLKGHLVELSGSFPTHQAVLEYLHQYYNSYNELTVYIMDYANGLDEDPIGGGIYDYNMDTYYACEDGIYHKEHYDEIDQGQGLKEIGSTYLVNIDLLPLPLKNDGELVELAIEKWFNSMDNSVPKPIWLI